ncbi:hypothetical protein GGS24DRAFT_91785 [Hypoxylon argillaceum]|nr:hypothetical protein GGS24DRAFT_91785 [Hypoxylon argillaceum]
MGVQHIFLVVVRKYRVLKSNALVESPNVDLKAQNDQIIVRTIDGEYKGEPRVIEDATSLVLDVDKKVYRDIAHGVHIQPNSIERPFPIWVCLQRNSEHSQDKHIWVLNLCSRQFLPVPIANICWVPSHEGRNGDLHTVISNPGQRGYEKQKRLPTIVQKRGSPEQTRLDDPFSSLLGFTKLSEKQRVKLYYEQLISMQQARETQLRIALRARNGFQRPLQFHTATDQRSKLPPFLSYDLSSSDEENTSRPLQARIRATQEQIPEGFCRCDCRYSDLGPTCFNRYPLHRHITDEQCQYGSMHRPHCIFAYHCPEHCVISGPGNSHAHCAVGGGVVEAVEGSDGDVEIESLPEQLQHLTDEPCFRDANRLLEDPDVREGSAPYIPTWCPNSGPASPDLAFLSGVQDDLYDATDLPEPAAPGTLWGRRGPQYRLHDLRTPEPPEMPI